MQTNTLRTVQRLGPLFAFSWRQPTVIRIGCRFLRASRRSPDITPTGRQNPHLQTQRVSPVISSLKSGSDWQDQTDEEPPRPTRRTDSEENSSTVSGTQKTGVFAEPTDLLMEKINKSSGLEAILQLIARHDRIMNHHHLTRTVQQLFTQIVKSKSNPLSESERTDLLKDERFLSLCSRLIRSTRYMSPGAAIDVLKLLSITKAAPDSRIVQTYLHLLKESINDLNIDSLMYAGFLMLKFPNNRIAEALLIAIPIAFELRVYQEMDPEDLPQLIRMLKFCTHYQVNRKTKETVTKSLKLRLVKDKSSKDTFPVDDAVELFVRMERGNIQDAELMNFLFDVIANRNLEFVHYGACRRFLGSVRYLRAKHPADFPPNHRIFAIEKLIENCLPPESNSNSATSNYVSSGNSHYVSSANSSLVDDEEDIVHEINSLRRSNVFTKDKDKDKEK